MSVTTNSESTPLVEIDQRGTLRAELESTRDLYMELVSLTNASNWNNQSGNPGWTVGQVLVNTKISPAQIDVRVLETGDAAAATEIEALLRRAGFTVLRRAQAPPGVEAGVILYAPELEDRAEVLGGYLPGVPIREGPAEVLGNADVAVVAIGGLVAPGQDA
jgi:hypothetical protein